MTLKPYMRVVLTVNHAAVTWVACSTWTDQNVRARCREAAQSCPSAGRSGRVNPNVDVVAVLDARAPENLAAEIVAAGREAEAPGLSPPEGLSRVAAPRFGGAVVTQPQVWRVPNM
jgi:hypothetical protein